jgi:hypothetical protein
MRSAAARAARRRGSSITMRPSRPGTEQGRGNARRLARARRGLKHGASRRVQRRDQLGQDIVDRQGQGSVFRQYPHPAIDRRRVGPVNSQSPSALRL